MTAIGAVALLAVFLATRMVIEVAVLKLVLEDLLADPFVTLILIHRLYRW